MKSSNDQREPQASTIDRVSARRALCTWGGFACVLVFSAHGHAQSAAARTPSAARPANVAQYVEFVDDLLDADSNESLGHPMTVRPLRPIRVNLIRPRTNFVAELYQSIEQI